jgi:hypothetical protein
MEVYSKPLENLLAAAYLSGAAEGLKKCQELSKDDVDKNLDDLKTLRRKFLQRSEEEGYRQPVHHIEQAKKIAYELLVQHTKYPNKSTSPINLNPTLSTPTLSTPTLSTPTLSTPTLSTPTNTLVSSLDNSSLPTNLHVSPNSSIAPTPTPLPRVLQLGGRKKSRRSKRSTKKR